MNLIKEKLINKKDIRNTEYKQQKADKNPTIAIIPIHLIKREIVRLDKKVQLYVFYKTHYFFLLE